MARSGGFRAFWGRYICVSLNCPDCFESDRTRHIIVRMCLAFLIGGLGVLALMAISGGLLV